MPGRGDPQRAYMAAIARAPTAPLSPTSTGGRIHVITWNRRRFDPAAVSIGLVPPRLRVHDLRHTAAALSIRSGANVKAVQRQLGHKSATMTLHRYGHLFPDELDALGAALDGLRPADDPRTVGGARTSTDGVRSL